jgi:L-lactate dehydrogenase complex protein LldG
MSSRERILDALRKTQSKAPPALASPHVRGSDQEDVSERFVRCAQALQSTCVTLASLREVPSAVATYLHQHQLPHEIALWPEFAALDWQAAGISCAERPALDTDLVGVSGCFAAIAETGTLMLCSHANTPATTSLLPETHIAIVPTHRIVATMEDGFALLRKELGMPPRAVNFVSGPSRTGDIEQTITLGAHGPYRVHILLIAEAP